MKECDVFLDTINKLFKKHGQYSQGLRALDIEGRRDSDMRYKMYNIDAYLKPEHTVLDIGCNCGFFSCLLAQKASSVVGFDKDKTLIQIAKIAADCLGLDNTLFVSGDFSSYNSKVQYNFVIASQIHYWVKIPFEQYVAKVSSLVKPGGYLLFESHDIQTVDKDIEQKVAVLSLFFDIVESGGWVEDPGKYWIPPKAHKTIPRKFYIMKRRDDS